MVAKVSEGVRLQDASNPTHNNMSIADGGVVTMGVGAYTAHSAANALTALAGGAQAGTALAAKINRFTTVTTGADSAQLPASLPGREVVVINAAASNSMNVFPQTGDAINASSANAAFAVAAGKTAMFFCAVAGKWSAILTA